MSDTPRRRLPAAEARARILDAAERHLVAEGPEGLRLAELAEELGVSHPAILHHFGSRDGLVKAVVERALTALNQELIGTFTERASAADEVSTEGLLARIAETLSDRGQARLLAWLILSGKESPQLAEHLTLGRLSAGVHAFRTAQGHRDDPADTAFMVQLTALVLLADAVFGERMRTLEGLPTGPAAAADFRARLARLIDAQFAGE